MAAHFNEDSEDDKFKIEDDYYTFLNIRKDATTEEITNAYRRLSKLYHPDKHTDPAKKDDAQLLFSKIQKAYAVLTDPHKRAVYDTLGVKGLETDGWQIIQRTKTPQEIREEYERLMRDQEERRLQQRTNPRGAISVGIDCTDLFERYVDDSLEFDPELESSIPHFEIRDMSISQSIDAPLTTADTLTLRGTLAASNGTGNGNVTASLRRVTSPTFWTEYEIGAGNGLVLGAKAYKTISKYSFFSVQGMFQFTALGLRPGLNVVVARQLSKHTLGYLTWKAGVQSSMNTTVVYNKSGSHFESSLQLGLPETFCRLMYAYQWPDRGRLRVMARLSTLGAMLEYGWDRKVSDNNTAGATMIISIPQGVTLRIKFSRSQQTFIFPMYLSEDAACASAIFYGTIAPVVTWYVVKTFVVEPYKQRQKKREADRAREANSAKIAAQRREAMAAVSLMTETYRRIRDQEETNGGLVIVEALYGCLQTDDYQRQAGDTGIHEVVDVAICLQCLVRDSRLVLTEASKSNLPGFYDPCLGEEKQLKIRYQYRRRMHEVMISDEEPLIIPKDSHLVHSAT